MGRLAAACILALSALAALKSAALARSVALVIGNSAYEHVPRLKNPAADAADVAAALERIGFDVTRATDLEMVGMLRTLSAFQAESRSARTAVIYFAGHGLEVDGRNYMIPIDARLADVDTVGLQTIDLALLTDATAGAAFSLVIVDACRENPFLAGISRSGRSVGFGLAPVEPARRQSLIAFAAASGALAYDGKGRNSPFATALIEALEAGPRDVRLMFGRVRERTMELTGDKQAPLIIAALGGAEVFLHAAAREDVDDGGSSPDTLDQAGARPTSLLSVSPSQADDAIRVRAGDRIMNADHAGDIAEVLEVFSFGITYRVNGKRTTCTEGKLCGFDWSMPFFFRVQTDDTQTGAAYLLPD